MKGSVANVALAAAGRIDIVARAATLTRGLKRKECQPGSRSEAERVVVQNRKWRWVLVASLIVAGVEVL